MTDDLSVRFFGDEPLLMAVQPGDEVTEDDGHMICRVVQDEDGRWWCRGYHCPYCGGPTSMYGHVTGSGDETRITCQEEADE